MVRWNAYPSADQYGIRVESPELEVPITETVASLYWSCEASRLSCGTLNVTIIAQNQGMILGQTVFQLVLTDDSANPTPTPEQTPAQPTPSSETTATPAPTATISPADATATPENNGQGNGKRPSSGWSKTFGSSGTGDLTPHDAALIELPEDELSALYLGDTGLMLSSVDGTFTASSTENQLYLSSEDDSCTFSFSQAALHMLGNSGVNQLSLVAGTHELTLDTTFDLNGFYYGQYRSKGYVSADFVFHVLQSHILVSIEDAVFELSEENELIPSSLEYSAAFGGHMP